MPINAKAQSWWERVQGVVKSDQGQASVRNVLGNESAVGSNLSTADISKGLREALKVSAQRVVSNIGKVDGFYKDKNIRIPLPKNLQRVHTALKAVGMDSLTNDLELRMNRAAEQATPKAKELLIIAITEMTLDDARNILNGPDNAATQYLRRVMGAPIKKDMLPIIDNTLKEAGAMKAYDNMMGRYEQIPFMPDVKANIRDYAAEKALDGIFYYIAQEEKAIRENPAKRTTELLRRVFSK
ncbi:MAG: DUF4197 family protein [Alphaproteobacteria bacterium]|nr:DUF4197 family protein [Alphaproteobacteria bacterium]